MSADKKPANYYGGFSLRRGGNSGPTPVPAAAVAQAHARQMAFFGSDWMAAASMPHMMNLFGMSTPPNPPTASSTSNQPLPTGGGVFNLFPSPNFYRGTPIVATQQSNSSSQPPVPQPPSVSKSQTASSYPQQNRAATTAAHDSTSAHLHGSHAAVARRIGAVPHMIDTWHSFDAIAPTRPSSSARLDPIGTKPTLRSSVWAGTPVADCAAQASSSAFQVDGLRPFSVWSSPTTSIATVLTNRVSSPVTKPKDATTEATYDEKSDLALATKAATTESSDDDADWMESLQHTLQAVMAFEEKSAQDGQDDGVAQQHPFMAMEWVQRATPTAHSHKHSAPQPM